MKRELTPESRLENLKMEVQAELVELFLRNAALDWRVGGSTRISLGRTAERLRRRHPDIARASIYTAVGCGDIEEVERTLAEHPEVVAENWECELGLN